MSRSFLSRDDNGFLRKSVLKDCSLSGVLLRRGRLFLDILNNLSDDYLLFSDDFVLDGQLCAQVSGGRSSSSQLLETSIETSNLCVHEFTLVPEEQNVVVDEV